MSTLSRDYEYGHIVAVDIVPLGDNLAADTLAGVTAIVVENASDFDEDGGRLVIGANVYTYTGYDDETSTITLTTGLLADTNEGTPVNVYDPVFGTIATEKIAQIALTNDDGNTNPIKATIALNLVDKIAEGIRGSNAEQVKLELDTGEWVVIDVLGAADPTGTGDPTAVFADQDVTVVDTEGVTQSIILKTLPMLNSEHVYWNGIYQPATEWSRDGNVITLPDPTGLMKIGDHLTCEYLYTAAGNVGDSYIEIIGTVYVGGAVSGSGPMSVPLPAGTLAGDLLLLSAGSWTGDVSCTDARFFNHQLAGAPISSLVAVGVADASGSDVVVNMGDTTWRHGMLTAVRGPQIASIVKAVTIGSPGTYAVPSPARRYILLSTTISAIVADNLDMPAAPLGAWTMINRQRSIKSGGMFCYADIDPDEVASLGSITPTGGTGGSPGTANVMILGVR